MLAPAGLIQTCPHLPDHLPSVLWSQHLQRLKSGTEKRGNLVGGGEEHLLLQQAGCSGTEEDHAWWISRLWLAVFLEFEEPEQRRCGRSGVSLPPAR